MLKATMEIGKVNKIMLLKFGIILKPDVPKNQYNYLQVESKFNYMGNEYYKLKPNPFVTIDISKGADKKEGWSINQSVNFNRIKLFEFLKKLREFIYKYKQYKNLYYYENNELKLNRQIASDLMIDIISSNKHIRMYPCVVPGGEDDENVFYEGAIFAINTLDNYCYLTYDEMEYLYYELSHIDMNLLSINIIQLIKQSESTDSLEEIKIPQHVTTQDEEEEEETIDSGRLVHIKRHSEMDDL